MKNWMLFAGILLITLGIGTVTAENQIIIGAIIDESGDSASYAPGIEAAIDLAIDTLNDSYASADMNTTVIVKKVMDDGTKEGAAKAAEELIGQGVQIIVGPTTSEEVSGVLPVLEKERIVSVNPSTSVVLSKPGDSVVRLCPDNSQLLHALKKYDVEISNETGMKTIILAREDAYGRDLVNNNTAYENLVDTQLYPKNTWDFTETLDNLDAAVSPLIGKNDEVMIVLISFDETTDLLAQAAAYPNLKKVQWLGMDSVALNPALLQNETAASFAQAAGLTAVSFNIAQPPDSDYWQVYDAVADHTSGHQPSIYEILAYDETLMAAWIIQNNPGSFEDMLYLADNYGKYSYAATGWLKLNENSDREYGDYYFYQVAKGGDGRYSWVPAYVYLYGSDTVMSLDGVNNTFMEHFQQ